MLNRRILRIKAMQTLYALKQGETANYHNALGYIDEVFTRDLMSMEKQDLKQLEQNKKRAYALFEELLTKGKIDPQKESAEVTEAAQQAIKLYHEQVKKDKKHFGKVMLKDVEGIYESYLFVLLLFSELADYSILEAEERKNKLINKEVSSSGELRLQDNKIIDLLKNNKDLIANSKKASLIADKEIVRKIYKQLFKNVTEEGSSSKNDFESDKKLILHIIKNVIFKEAYLQEYLEGRDLSWTENKSIVRSMVSKTIKSIEEGDKSVTLLSISANWEEDKTFFEELYEKTVDNDKELEEITSEKIKNWDIERVAALDRIILIMAISEMINFPSIPVKVTINEYIELSKLYSTPKSKQFINGILDKLAEDLTKKGVIKKSGRGLIDNK